MARFLALGGCIVVLLATGCSGTTTPVANTALPTFAPIPTLTPTSTIQPTIPPVAQTTPTIPSIVKVPPFDTADMQLKSQCSPIRTGLMAGDPSGRLFLYLDRQRKPTLLDLSSGKRTPFIPSEAAETAYGEFAISPDGQWVAYSRYLLSKDDHKLVAASSDGKEIQEINWQHGWVQIARWVGTQRVAIQKTTTSTPAFDLVNPSTGESQVLFTDFPGIYSLLPFPNWDRLGETAYDPTLTYVAALHFTDDSTDGVEILFQNVGTQQVLARIYPVFTNINVSWAQDGSFFVYPNSYWDRKLFPDWYRHNSDDDFELYRVDNEGNVTQITDLEKYYSSVSIDNFSISPDGKKIAFWLTVDPLSGADPTLASLSLETHEVTVTCISSQDAYFAPVWDLGSSMLAMKGYAKDDHGSSDLIIMRLSDGEAVDLGEGLEPVGWLAEMP